MKVQASVHIVLEEKTKINGYTAELLKILRIYMGGATFSDEYINAKALIGSTYWP